MTSCADLRVLFCAAAGARRGYGHLVRCLSFARALGVRPLIAVRGGDEARDVALGLGADVIESPWHEPYKVRATRKPSGTSAVIAALRPDVVVVDDPIESEARRSIAAARRARALVVTIHDLGIGCPDGDLVIDGSATNNARAANGGRSLSGTRFALLDPEIARLRSRVGRARVARTLSGPRGEPEAPHRAGVRGGDPAEARPAADKNPQKNKQVLIALGGGPHVKTAAAIARAIVGADPEAQVRIAGGFVARPRTVAPRVTWVNPRRGLAPELAGADVAVVGGGVSLYEACAMGVPAVALPVADGQVPTVRAFAERGAAIGLGSVGLHGGAGIRAAAAQAVALLNSPDQRAALARRSTRLVDGHGASRAAAAVAALSQGN